MEKPFRKILVIKMRFHGDMLLTTPVISTLKRHYPDAKIDVLLYQDTMPILSENLPHVKSGGVLLKLPVYKNQKAEESVAPWGRLCYTGFAIKCSAKRGAVRWRT